MSLTNFEGIKATFALLWRCASAPNPKFAHTGQQGEVANFGFTRGTRIMNC